MFDNGLKSAINERVTFQFCPLLFVYHFAFDSFVYLALSLCVFSSAMCDREGESLFLLSNVMLCVNSFFASFTFNLVGFVCFGSNQLCSISLSLYRSVSPLCDCRQIVGIFCPFCRTLCIVGCETCSHCFVYDGKQIKKLHV